MQYRNSVIHEAIRELEISDEPSVYKKVKRLARKYIKRQVVEPIDIINWPKGCIAVGLMSQVEVLEASDDPRDAVIAALILSTLKGYINRWIAKKYPVYLVDDCLFGQALLSLIKICEMYPELADASEKADYNKASANMMSFLYSHDKDICGSLPYRPTHKTGDIYADSIGMVAPYAIRYGVMMEDDQAIELGITQIRNFMKYGIDYATGVPYHVYSLSDGDDTTETSANGKYPGWGRALGWIFYGVRASYEVLVGTQYEPEIRKYLDRLSDIAEKLIDANGLFGSNLLDKSEVDTSASAMIIYGLGKTHEKYLQAVESLIKYITEDGQVRGCQAECMGLGLYSDTYASYPWSVGMSLLVI